jgi:hypothetical protein
MLECNSIIGLQYWRDHLPELELGAEAINGPSTSPCRLRGSRATYDSAQSPLRTPYAFVCDCIVIETKDIIFGVLNKRPSEILSLITGEDGTYLVTAPSLTHDCG